MPGNLDGSLAVEVRGAEATHLHRAITQKIGKSPHELRRVRTAD
jgi:hypothetical protein